MSSLSTVFRRAPDVRYRVLDGEAVVIRQRIGRVLGLNELGAKVLDALDGERTLGEILDSLADGYEVERAQLDADVLGFLGELAAEGIVSEVEA